MKMRTITKVKVPIDRPLAPSEVLGLPLHPMLRQNCWKLRQTDE
jgi:hypothetical protein